jgi:HEAT repeat protein
VSALIELTASPDPAVAVSAVRALGSIGGAAAIDKLQDDGRRRRPKAARDVAAALLACAARLGRSPTRSNRRGRSTNP